LELPRFRERSILSSRLDPIVVLDHIVLRSVELRSFTLHTLSSMAEHISYLLILSHGSFVSTDSELRSCSRSSKNLFSRHLSHHISHIPEARRPPIIMHHTASRITHHHHHRTPRTSSTNEPSNIPQQHILR
jgi:ABC-type nickel/cobalt efflux system permease component RcnA